MMIRGTTALVALVCLLIGCSEEGGSRGSGISSAIEGNVAAIQAAGSETGLASAPRRADAAEAVAGIDVIVEGTSLRTQTDSTGTFSLRGGFDGPVSVLFQRAADQLTARIAVKIPAGATLTLVDVEIDAAEQQAYAAVQQMQCEGIVTDTDCTASTMTMVSAQDSPSTAAQYVVRLDTSTIQNSQGAPLTCSDLHTGQRTMIEAEVNPDGSFGNGTIEVENTP